MLGKFSSPAGKNLSSRVCTVTTVLSVRQGGRLRHSGCHCVPDLQFAKVGNRDSGRTAADSASCVISLHFAHY